MATEARKEERLLGKKMRKAIKRLSKNLDEMRVENRELVEGLTERMIEALERQAESNRDLTQTLESYLNALDRSESSSRGDAGDSVSSKEDQEQETLNEQGEPEATEAAERRAHELGVDLSAVKGTGSGGLVLVKDVEEAAG